MWEQVELALRESFTRVITKLAVLLPGALALLLTLLLFTLVALLIAYLLRRILAAVRFDERVGRNANLLAEWSPRQSPSELLTRIAFWGCIVIGIVVGVSAFDAASNGAGIVAFMLPYIAHTIGAIVILIVGNIVARFLSRSVLIGSVNLNLQYARFLSLGVEWMVLVLTAAMVLDHIGIGGIIVELAFGILFGGIVLTLSLAIGLGSRELVSRSLERDGARPAEEPSESLRHF